jgi:hypothetical protein
METSADRALTSEMPDFIVQSLRVSFDNKDNGFKYVFHSYGHLMTERERLAFGHIGGTMKATLGRSDVNAQQEAKNSASYLRAHLTDDPEVLALARDGYDAFVLRTGRRILNENRDAVFLNYCPRCGNLARTPKARQCRSCGHDWHD